MPAPALTPLHNRLTSAIDAQDVAQVAMALRGAPEKERRLCNADIRRRLKGLWDYDGKYAALSLAALGVAQTAPQAVRAIENFSVEDHAETAAAILTERAPAWLVDFTVRALATRRRLFGGWQIVRELVRAGAVPAPDAPAYIALLPHTVRSELLGGSSLRQKLLDDPGLLQDEVYRLFEVEEAGDALKGSDKNIETVQQLPLGPPPLPLAERSPHTWRVTLVRLCEEGRLDRDRLLDACLSALLAGFRPSRIPWYLTFHAELAPTGDEVAARAERYLALLAVEPGSAVALAQRALAAPVAAGRVDPAALIKASVPVLGRTEKKQVIAQLRLLEALVRCHPALAGDAARTAAIAAAHPRADVAEKAARFVGRYGATTR